MGIFGKSHSELKDENSNLRATNSQNESYITDLRDQIADLEIKLIRKSTENKINHEWDLNQYRLKIADLTRELEVAVYNVEEQVDDQVTEKVNQLTKQAEADRATVRKELRGEFADKVKNLETKNANLVQENGKISGLYAGTLLLVKSLESQLSHANKQNETLQATLAKALPDVSVKTGESNQSVVVNG